MANQNTNAGGTMTGDNASTSGYIKSSVWNAKTSRATPQQLYPNDPSCQPCPDCGGLECFCRPRFFAGQLLSEQDLNRLDGYIKGKNRLHNRYLWGSGVVCGLEVRCHPCGDAVSVSPGYALSPCGDDIVVCKSDVVDICKLISQCSTTTMPDCSPYSANNGGCDDLFENWILAVRYEERSARGITALTGASQGSCACGRSNCTGTSAGGCGCAGMPQLSSNGATSGAAATGTTAAGAQTATTQAGSRSVPPACEPTLTCESYRYEVYRAPASRQQPVWGDRAAGLANIVASLDGDLPKNFGCCALNLFAAAASVPPMPAAFNSQYYSAWYQWACAAKQAAITYFSQYGGYDCQTIYQLQAIVIPQPTDQSFATDFGYAVLPMFYIFIGELIGCLCSSALPPCPDAGDPRVPLAMVTVRPSDCTIISVCNWTPQRKHVVTFPNLAYWWGWLPYTDIVRQFMNFLCCDELGFLSAVLGLPAAGSNATNADGTQDRELERRSDPMSAPISFNAVSYAFNTPAGTVARAFAQNLQNASDLTAGDLVKSIFQPAPVGTGAATTQAEDVRKLAATPAMKTLTEILRPLTQSIPSGVLQAIIGAAAGSGAAGGGSSPQTPVREEAVSSSPGAATPATSAPPAEPAQPPATPVTTETPAESAPTPTAAAAAPAAASPSPSAAEATAEVDLAHAPSQPPSAGAPSMPSAAPPSAAAAPPPAAAPAPAARAASSATDIAELQTRLTQLQQTVVEQQTQIDALRNSPSGGR